MRFTRFSTCYHAFLGVGWICSLGVANVIVHLHDVFVPLFSLLIKKL
jgi:hypothetical protein